MEARSAPSEGFMSGGALGRKLGPLPVWAWGIAVGGGFLVYRMISGRGNPTSPDGTEVLDPEPETNSGVGPQGVPGPTGKQGPAGPKFTLPKQPKCPVGQYARWNGTAWVCRPMPCPTGKHRDANGKCVPNASALVATGGGGRALDAPPIQTFAANNGAPSFTTGDAGSIGIAPPDTTPISAPRVHTGSGNSMPVDMVRPVYDSRGLRENPIVPYGGGEPVLLQRVPPSPPFRVPGRPSHHNDEK